MLARINTVDTCQDINHDGRRAHAEESSRLHEVLRRQTFEGSAELSKRGENRVAILRVGANQNIEIFRRARLCVKGDRIAAND